MQAHQSPLLKIYSSTSKLLSYKRKLFQNLIVKQLPVSALEQKSRMSSTKIYLCLKKVMSELQKQMEIICSVQGYQQHFNQISSTVIKLKNDKELLTKEEQIIASIEDLKEGWNGNKDPLVFYDLSERQRIKTQISQKLDLLRQNDSVNKQTKKPFYIRKLERQLKNNLENIGEQERNFNKNQQILYLSIKSKLCKLIEKMLDAIRKKSNDSLVNEEKNELVKNYIDVFKSQNNKNSNHNKGEVVSYKRDLIKCLRNILNIFKEEKDCFLLLMNYIRNLEIVITNAYKQQNNMEELFSKENQGISEQIFAIVSFEEILPIIHDTKNLFVFLKIWKALEEKIKNNNSILEEAMNNTQEYIEKVSLRETDKVKSNQVQQFIQDKKVIQSLVKKQCTFEKELFQALEIYLDSYLRHLKEKNLKKPMNIQLSKFKMQKAFDRLFMSYYQETQAFEKKSDRNDQRESRYTSLLTLRQNNNSKITEFQDLIKSLTIFEETVDMNESFHCSLGPRLLIHGKLKPLPTGIYYESNFNQSNYFFGKTKLFLPKSDIFEINKQRALFIFPDVLEIITKFGGVYFHALGQREELYNLFMKLYLPEANQQNVVSQQYVFNQFKGSQQAIASRMKLHTAKFENMITSGEVPNINLRNYFHKYQSDQQFIHQGKTYKDFNFFTCQLAEGKNIKSSDFVPGIPYYFKIKSDQTKNITDDIEQSERVLTYNKAMPSIPFFSKGGDGICNQKIIFHWGGPKLLVLQLLTTISGFSLVEGMIVKCKKVLQQRNNSVHYQISSQIEFTTNSAMNSILRGPSLSNLQLFMLKIMDKIILLQKNKKVAVPNSKDQSVDRQLIDQKQQNIKLLQLQVVKLKNIIKYMSIAFSILLVVIIVTLLLIRR